MLRGNLGFPSEKGMLSDPIGDMLARIKNGYLARKASIEVPYSKIKEELAKILAKEEFITQVRIVNLKSKTQKTLKIDLKYEDKKPAIQGIKRKSRPGLRIYTRWQKIPRVLGGLGILVISTSKGLMTGKEARKEKLGGEIVCEVW